MNFQPGDKVEYLPSGNWIDGCKLAAVVIKTIESGHRDGCIQIELTDPDWRTRGALRRIVSAAKVRLR